MLDVAIDAREFDADVAVLCVHVYGFAWKGAALCAISTRAESCGLGKDQRHQCVGILRLAEQGEQSTRPVLFHLHGSGVDVERTCGQGLFLEIAVDLRIHIVEIGLDNRNFFVETGTAFSAASPIMMRRTLGWPSRSAEPAP